jgi:hypothetical protein
MITSDEDVHVPLVIIHLNTLSPVVKEVTVEDGLAGLDILPLPLILDQLPVPLVGVLAAKVAEGEVMQMACCVPAAEVVAGAST